MLIGIPSILGPEMLATLRAMGHGDEIAIVDGNYPALEDARRLIRADGHGVIAILDAILQVLPVDDFVPEALFRATAKDDPDKLDPVHREMVAVCRKRAPDHRLVPLVGDAFYRRVKGAHAVVATSEPRLYGNIIIRKGVIYPPS
jgi:L-fucose mutarotase